MDFRPAHRSDGGEKIAATYPLAPLQHGMLFHALSAPGSGVDIEQMVGTLREKISATALRAAWGKVVARHAILRTAFRCDAEPVQEVWENTDVPWLSEDWRENGDRDARLAAWLHEDRRRGFAMDEAPLMRLALFQFGDADFRLVWTFHHALLDGRSILIVLREVFAAFDTPDAPLPPVPRPYRDYIEWRQTLSPSASADYWRETLRGFSAPTPLTVEGLPGRTPEPAQGDHDLRLSPALTHALRDLAAAHDFTLNTLVQGAWSLLLSRYSGETDVVFGATRACRRSTLDGAADMAGLFINTLPVRVRVADEREIIPWLRDLRAQWIAMRPHEHTPLASVQAWSEVRGGRALFDSIVVFENHELNATLRAFGGAWAHREFRLYEQTNFPLTLAAYAGPELLLRLEFDRTRFGGETIARLLGHLAVILAAFAENPYGCLRDVPLLTKAEEQKLLVEWNSEELTQRRKDAKGESPASALGALAPWRETLHEIFASQAARTPDAIALTCDDTHLTYRQLDARAAQLATHLRALGVGPEIIVGLCMERSAELIIGLLAILKAGGAYLPLDLAYPAERIAFILKDARAPVLLTQRHLAASLPQDTARVLCIDDLPPDVIPHPIPPAAADTLAYVIYTSGSTGQPKGCCITHRNVTRLFTSTDEWFRFSPADVWTMFHSVAFDFSVWEIWGALLYGGRVVIVPHRITRSPEQFHELLRRERVTILNQTPSAFRQFIAADEAAQPPVGMALRAVRGERSGAAGRPAPTASLRSPADGSGVPSLPALRLVIFGGEALELQSLQPWFDRHGDTQPQLVNMYGITETTVHVTYRPLRASDISAGSVIGVPIPDLQIYILDPAQRPLPIGVPGELYVGGAGVARGYLHRPELTAQRFIKNPLILSTLNSQLSTPLYRTGDLARWLPGRDIEYLGRIDQQVKIRGFRIELGEIESVLVQHGRIREAVVVARHGSGGEKRLVAYLVPAGEMPAADELRAHLKAKLPDYMVPAAFVALARLPLTNNGKIDTRALPEPAPARPELAAAFAPPRTPAEQALAGIWRDVLRLDRAGVHDNFFALGGDSILSIQIITRARQAGLALTPRHLFENQTIAELAAFAAPAAASASDQSLVTGPAPLTPIQHWFFEGELAEMHHWNQAFLFQTTAPLDCAALARAALAVERHHDALRLRFRRGAAGWEQTFAAPTEAAAVGRCTLAEATAVQASMSLADGPLWQLALIGDDRLLIAIHHLAVDGVSWRILLEDLATAYVQLRAGQPVQLPAKTTSFQKWAAQLSAHASSSAPDAELAHWLAVTGPALPADFAGENYEASARTITVSLDADETRALLQDVPGVYRTQINDVLLTALAQAVGGSVLLDLEGHGREDLGTSADLSRTVGWFTTIFPVSLKTDAAAPGDALKSVKEQLRQIPRRGLGYGALRYLRAASPLAAQPRPDILFNYLGQFDQVVADSPLFRFAADSPGPWHSPRAARRHALEINSLIANERLELRWTYSENLHRAETIERLAERYVSALRALIAHCQSPGAGGRTPSDFPLARLDQATVDRLISVPGNVEDILSLAPMQALFYTLGSVQSRPADQWQCRLHGTLDVPAFQRAWREVVQRHTILRTAFRADALAEPVQLVLRAAELPWTLADWRSAAAEQPRQLAEFLAADRPRGFDLARPPLMRFALLRLGEDEHHFVWSLPDVLIDGWSWPLVFREVSALYESRRRGAEAALERRRPYRDYVAWMQRQDFADAEKFWRKKLRGFAEPTPLPVAPASAGESFAERRLHLSVGETDALTAFARTHQLTPGTLVQAAWALLLARHSGRDDVVFGAAFSGRPTDLPGAESIVGPFVNNLPVRARIDGSEAVPAFLKRLHAEVFDLSQHQFSPLVQVQGWSEMPWRHRLFDSLLVFQNYLVDEDARRLGRDVEIRDFTGPLHTNYALTLLAVPGPELALTLLHRPSQLDAATAAQLLADVRAALAALPSAATVAAVSAQLSPPLPAATSPPALSQNYIAPQTPTEHAIARVWAEAFGRERVGTHDNFFDLGGHSLLMLQVHARLRAALQTDLPLVAMFQFSTISALARHLDRPADAAPSFQHLRDRAQQQREALARKRLLRTK